MPENVQVGSAGPVPAASKEPCTISNGALLLVIPPLAFYILSDLLFLYMGWHGVGNAPAPIAILQAREEAASRLLILAGALAVAGAGFFAILSFGADVVRLFGNSVRARLLGSVGAGIVVAGIYFATAGNDIPVYRYVGHTLIENASQQFTRLEACVPKPAPRDPAEAPVTPSADATSGKAAKPTPTPSPTPLVCSGDDTRTVAKPSMMDKFRALMATIRVLLIVAAGALIGGAVSCLAEPTGQMSDEQRLDFFEGQHKRLRRYVNLAALLMVAGMAFMIAWMRWPLPLMSEAAMAKAYTAHVDALAIFFGVTYSLVIASYAGPVTAVLRSQLAKFQRAANGPVELDLFDKGALTALGKVLVVLAPALAGALPAVLDALGVLT